MDTTKKELAERVKKYPNIARCLEKIIREEKIGLYRDIYHDPNLEPHYTIFNMLLNEKGAWVDWGPFLAELDSLIPLSGLPDDEIKRMLIVDPFAFESELHFRAWVESQGFKAQMRYLHLGKDIDVLVKGNSVMFLVEVITPHQTKGEAIKLKEAGRFISNGQEYVKRLPGLIDDKIDDKRLLETPDKVPTLLLVDGRYWGLDDSIVRNAVRKILKNQEKRENFTGVIVRIRNQYHLVENADVLPGKKLMAEHPECGKLFSGFDFVRATDLDFPSEELNMREVSS